MPLTNRKAQDILTTLMDNIAKDTSIDPSDKVKLLTQLNNSEIRNSHVELRAIRLASTMTSRKQTLKNIKANLLTMPMLK